MSRPIDFYFDFASPYGFIASTAIDEIATRAKRNIVWRPFLLGAVFQKFKQSPLEHPAKREYVNNRDALRSGRLKGLAMKTPQNWPEHSIPPSRIFYWIDQQDPEAAAGYAKAAYKTCWLEGKSTANAELATDVATSLGFDRDQVSAAIQDQAIKDRLVAENNAALDRGVFGSPFIFVDDEPFWGSDRLDQVAIWLERGPF